MYGSRLSLDRKEIVIMNGGMDAPHGQLSHNSPRPGSICISCSVQDINTEIRATHSSRTLSDPSGNLKTSSEVTLRKNSDRQSRSMSWKIQEVLKEQRETTLGLIQDNVVMQDHLSKYKEFLLERKQEHAELYSRILALANQNRELAEQINGEYERVSDIQNEGESLKNKLQERLDHLDGTPSNANEYDESREALEKWNSDCHQEIPNTSTICLSGKIMRNTKAALSMVITETEDHAAHHRSTNPPALCIAEKLNKAIECSALTLTSLHNLSQSTKKDLLRGTVYAIQFQEGHILRSALVTVKDNRTFLHCLQEGGPPHYAHTFRHSDLTEKLKPKSVDVFMDLTWGESVRGRILIRLSPDTPFAHHFRILCTGDLGYSYAKSRFFQVHNKGDAMYESLKGGDYEYNDGRGGAPLMSGLNINKNIYRRSWIPGVVCAVSDEVDGPKTAQFSITIGNGNSGAYLGAFGHVYEGLDILKAAATCRDIRDVSIADCGVVLPS